MPRRSLPKRIGWTLRDYAKRVWDNAGEDNVLFLAGGILDRLAHGQDRRELQRRRSRMLVSQQSLHRRPVGP